MNGTLRRLTNVMLRAIALNVSLLIRMPHQWKMGQSLHAALRTCRK